MPSILHINASPRYGSSDSLGLARHFIDSVQSAAPETFELETLNLFDDDALPAFGRVAASAKMAVFTGQEQTPEQMAAWEAARSVFDQFAAADAYVFNIPMWNSGIPYALKQWIDIVTQPGWSSVSTRSMGTPVSWKGSWRWPSTPAVSTPQGSRQCSVPTSAARILPIG
ncbi:NAD(P)H-dependent oxidoreductase [Paenarthrobacter sp. CC6]|uniref:NAD(P)H-dependent oxidoreductase n=1 Tax=Paenarthrobacter sp. CC6 TaxID=3029184 RepID=UPI00339C9E8E